MAEHASDYTHGHMDVRQNQASFHVFMRMAKWGSLGVAVLVLAATLAFCTSAGIWNGFVAGVVLAVLGVVFLREKPAGAGAH